MELDKKLIGIRIMQRRKACGYTQEQLSEEIGLSKNHISSVERGHQVPTTQRIIKLCNVLGETPDYYLIGTPSSKTDKITELIKSLPSNVQEITCKLIETYIEAIHNI